MGRDFAQFPVPPLAAVAATAGVPRGRSKIIICPATSVEKGFLYEAEPLAPIPWDSPTEVLGQRVWEALLLFRRTPNLNLRSRKKTDWPAFRAPGSKSVRAFEGEFVRIVVQALGSVLRVEGLVPADAAAELFVGRHISNACEFEGLGDLIRLVFRCSLLIPEREFEPFTP
jgi:hypothetical protein